MTDKVKIGSFVQLEYAGNSKSFEVIGIESASKEASLNGCVNLLLLASEEDTENRFSYLVGKGKPSAYNKSNYNIPDEFYKEDIVSLHVCGCNIKRFRVKERCRKCSGGKHGYTR